MDRISEVSEIPRLPFLRSTETLRRTKGFLFVKAEMSIITLILNRNFRIGL